jgi:hypothetical protein
MPPIVLQVPDFTLEDLGDDGKRVLLLLDNDWHRDVTLEILQLVVSCHLRYLCRGTCAEL